MAAALLLMLVSGLFIGAWVSLMSTRAAQVSFLETAVQRRLSLENSKQFSTQCALDKAFEPDADLSGNQSAVFAGNRGGLNTGSGWTDLNVYSTTDTPGTLTTVYPYNYTGLRPLESYLSRGQFARPSGVTDFDSLRTPEETEEPS